ncbi:hypothetical protein CYMTET_6371 [Cymbomonas tetramitiformis]|uniref:EF-hand domain-containing protein n=1 Tax=Cymbomonas tetramitiformis TaxID=36881 RepID=A0AAE0GXM8_9CHLO|nr:hypothetical protein CYMTET_6371 [Cymbomonas tetramitiformis]|eukprot:gene15164-17941_t
METHSEKKTAMLSESMLYTLRYTFNRMDKDQNGSIDREEMQAALKKANIDIPEEEWKACLTRFDRNQNSCLEFDEFVQIAEEHARPAVSKTHFSDKLSRGVETLSMLYHDEDYYRKHPAYCQFKTFANAGTSGMASAALLQPVDTVKVQLQMGAQGSPLSVARSLGIGGLYSGVSAALLRQATYTTARIGIFQTSLAQLSDMEGGGPSVATKTGCAIFAGALGAVVGTPADMALVRMQVDGRLPVADRRNYTGVGDALLRSVKERGVPGLFAGCGPTVTRAIAMNVGQLVSHDQARQMMARAGMEKTGNANIFGSSLIAGLVGSLMSLPFDAVKTRLQQMKPDPRTGALPYRGVVDCAAHIFIKGGVLSFYRGLGPYLGRQLPHSVLTFVFISKLMNMERHLEMQLEFEKNRSNLPSGYLS